MKKGFGLWQAIMIILIISGLMVVVLKYSRIAAKHTADTYVREQLELYLNSAVEMTLLAISRCNRNVGGLECSPSVGNCLASYDVPEVEVRSVKYNVHVDITRYYLLTGDPDLANCSELSYAISTAETHGMVLMEIEAVATQDGNITSRILRRTLQRP